MFDGGKFESPALGRNWVELHDKDTDWEGKSVFLNNRIFAKIR